MTVNYQDIINKYKSYDISIDEPKVRKALEFAVKYHGDQTRDSGEPYYYHPIEVADIIAEMKLDTDSIVTAILHDTIEDTDLTLTEIEQHFGYDVATLVDGVTKLTKIKFKEDNVRQAENFRKLLIAMSNDIRVLLVKLADRVHNMRTIDSINNPDKRKRIALETIEIYAPLAERIGVHQIKTELQDICFRVLYPDIRQSIIYRFETIESAKDKFISKIIDELKILLKSHNFKADVVGRRKTAYSTWMKMRQKKVEIDQLSDIIAFRIIVDDKVEDCYRALGIIHSTYKMVPNSFQDFISTPKSNDYQSLHTIVVGPLQQKVEIQIRTQKMHDIAEFGVAAHWRYKQDHRDSNDGKQYACIRELISILNQNNDPNEFLQNTKLAMYYDQVFCFTPKGNLIALPKGATIIDFAYMVHTDLGNSCVGAKVNDRVVPLKTQLVNGDQVEIITSKNETVVSPTWEKFIVTGKARGEIRKFIQNQKRDQYIKLGQSIITQALRDAKIQDEYKALQVACDFFSKSMDDLFFAIGRGIITREDVINNAMPKKSRLNSTLSLLKFDKRRRNSENKDSAIAIKGLINDMAIHYAKCCHPLPGDKILGILHSDSGVTVHTLDCQMLNNFAGMPEKILDLTWNSDKLSIPFVSRVKVLLINTPGSLAALTNEISKNNANITNFKIVSRNNGYFEMIFDIEVNSSEDIDRIINSLSTKSLIQKIERYKG